MPEEKPPVTCMFCGKVIGPSEVMTMVTKTSLDENGEPDFSTQTVDGMAHSECWEREGPDPREEPRHPPDRRDYPPGD